MDTLQHLQNELIVQFDTARPDVAALLDVLHQHLLPDVQRELRLTGPDRAWLSEWLSDTASVFRLLRHHKFIRPFTLQQIRSIATWRVRVLRPVLLLSVPAIFHCLPPPITDPFGRPILFLKLAPLQSFPPSVKDALLQEVERLRLHLRYIRDHCAHSGSFPLQYILLLDLDGVSIQNYNLDLCSWILTDIIPRYPGMFAAVFVLNYSWIHSGAWTLAKRILPSSLITRVCFPSRAQLVRFCSAANLPAEYGGSLPTLDRVDDALRSPYQTRHFPPPPPPLPARALGLDDPAFSPATASVARVPSTIALPPMSLRNPFFGYPVVVSASRPHAIERVKRGPRELARTLAVLWWRRWGRWVWAGACVAACVAVVRRRLARRAGGAWARTGEGGRTATEIGARVAALGALVSTWTARTKAPRAQT